MSNTVLSISTADERTVLTLPIRSLLEHIDRNALFKTVIYMKMFHLMQPQGRQSFLGYVVDRNVA